VNQLRAERQRYAVKGFSALLMSEALRIAIDRSGYDFIEAQSRRSHYFQ
jgi:hypothetical protein